MVNAYIWGLWAVNSSVTSLSDFSYIKYAGFRLNDQYLFFKQLWKSKYMNKI